MFSRNAACTPAQVRPACDGRYKPAAQLSQAGAAKDDPVPSGQIMHTVVPGVEYVPAKQLSHVIQESNVWRQPSWYLPPAHSLHVGAPAPDGVYFPATQSMQIVLPT